MVFIYSTEHQCHTVPNSSNQMETGQTGSPVLLDLDSTIQIESTNRASTSIPSQTTLETDDGEYQ